MGLSRAERPRVGFWQDVKDVFGLRPRPVAVTQVEVTSVCSASCAYCPHTTMRRHWKSRHMALETYVRLWPLFCESGRVHLQGWGEPLAHPDFLSMVTLAREAGCQVSTTTSGLRMDRELAVALVESGLDVVAFSLAGATPVSNDSLRVGVPFERVLESIRLLQEVRRTRMAAHLEVHVAYLLLADRMNDIDCLPDLVQQLGVHAVVVSIPDQTLVPHLRDHCFAPHDAAKVRQARERLREAARRVRDLGFELHYALPGPESTGRCFEGATQSVFIDAEGAMAPCVHLNLPVDLPDSRRRVFGSCLTDDPVVVWKSPSFATFRARLSSGNPDSACLCCPKRFVRSGAD